MAWYVVGLIGVMFVVLGMLVLFAPEGYEDENGFHIGRKDDEP